MTTVFEVMLADVESLHKIDRDSDLLLDSIGPIGLQGTIIGSFSLLVFKKKFNSFYRKHRGNMEKRIISKSKSKKTYFLNSPKTVNPYCRENQGIKARPVVLAASLKKSRR